MESHQQQGEEMNMSMNTSTNNNNNNNGGKMSVSSTSNSSYLCRQSSTRWTPTSEQIKLLKELYYINGVRSPSADQIQSICSRLRRYGKIEGKNVFYWFQNHKARERQKKRLTPTTSSCTTTTANNPLLPTASNPHLHNNSPTTTTNNNNNLIINNNGGLTWRQQDHHQDVTTLHAKHPYSINNPGVSCSSSSNGVVSNGGQFMGNFGYGAVTMENKFRDCSISGGGYVLNNGGANNVNQWNGANGAGYVLNGGGTNYNPYAPAYSNFLDKISTIDEDPYIEQDHYGAESPQIETLPLFPLHNENHDHDYDHDHDHDHHHHHGHGFYAFKPPSDGYYTGGYRWSNGSGGNASLELSLNSYGYGCYSQNL